MFKKFSKKHGINADFEVLPDSTTAFWVGNKDADNIILQFHGGGYCLPISEPCLDYMLRIKESLAKKGKDIGILNLAYGLFFSHYYQLFLPQHYSHHTNLVRRQADPFPDLLPVAKYPRQLQQAAMILEHLIVNLKKDPSKIILMGDSAGANLVLALLSHLNHPHPDQSIPRLTLSSPLQAAVLVSAWVSFKDDVPSMQDNIYSDLVTFTAATRWAEEYLNEKYPFWSSNEYTAPRDAAPEWWNGLPVQKVISVCSEDEGLFDLIRDFLGKLKIGIGADRVVEDTVKGECHDAIYFLEMFTGKDSKQGQVVEQRILELF
jgi:acetyl esterase/lipase